MQEVLRTHLAARDIVTGESITVYYGELTPLNALEALAWAV